MVPLHWNCFNNCLSHHDVLEKAVAPAGDETCKQLLFWHIAEHTSPFVRHLVAKLESQRRL